MSVKIITDSTSYLTDEMLKKYDIDVISLSVSLNGVTELETEIDNEMFYDEIEATGDFPKSSQPSIGSLYNMMENIIKNGDDIVGVFLSSKMSGTYSSALAVRQMILDDYRDANIRIIDSTSNCMQLGLIVLEGAIVAFNGLGIDKVVERINHTIPRTKFIFIPNNLEYLKKGGRIGSASALAGNILKLIPILTVKDGMTDVIQKIRKKNKAISRLVEIVREDNLKYDIKKMYIHHIQDLEEGELILKELEQILNMEIELVDIGPVIGSHVGPKAIGIAYLSEEEIRW